MHEPSRRRVLAGVGAGVAGLLAGCGAPSRDEGTSTPSPTPTATPALPADAPDFWRWLPTPTALGTGAYPAWSLALPNLRAADLDQRNLNPRRYAPSAVKPVVETTEDLLTIGSPDDGVGVLRGDYNVGAITATLADAGLSETEEGFYAGETITIRVGAEQLRWANTPEGSRSLVRVLEARLDGDGTAYPADDPALSTLLEALVDASATFFRPMAISEGAFATARFLGTGIGSTADAITWRTAVVFEDAVPTDARDHYQTQFEDKQGFSNIRTRTSGDLLVMDAETSVAWATSTQPI